MSHIVPPIRGIPARNNEDNKPSERHETVENNESSIVDEESESEMDDFIVEDSDTESDDDDFVADDDEDEDCDDDDCDDDDNVDTKEDEPPDVRESSYTGDTTVLDDGIDPANIITGKRRRQTAQRYDDQVFKSEEYARMILCDVPAEEMEAALFDENFSDDDESADDAYESEEDGEEDENESEEEQSVIECASSSRNTTSSRSTEGKLLAGTDEPKPKRKLSTVDNENRHSKWSQK